jgi:hypothetical protein
LTPGLIQVLLLHLAVVPLVSFKLEQFLSFSLSFKTLTFLKNTGQCCLTIRLCILGMNTKEVMLHYRQYVSRNVMLVCPIVDNFCNFDPMDRAPDSLFVINESSLQSTLRPSILSPMHLPSHFSIPS